jgi:glutamine amidotransferase
LQAEIDTASKQIDLTQLNIESLELEIEKTQAELDRQTEVLKETLRALYKEGDVTTIELLASSDSYGDFIAQQEYLGRLKDGIKESAEKKPFLGICMGMQVLMSHSEENNGVDCLGLYEGDVKFFGDRFDASQHDLKIPQMGWNQVEQREHPLWHDIENGSRFYFVHSYYVEPVDDSITTGTTEYGFNYTSALGKNNVFAVQFHPEKSAADGLQLLKNFSQWDGK